MKTDRQEARAKRQETRDIVIDMVTVMEQKICRNKFKQTITQKTQERILIHHIYKHTMVML